jgi:predicted DNA-binding protein with PD1-like motif
MIYTGAKIGRTFVIKFEDKDDLIVELDKFIRKEKIKTGFFMFLGGLKKGDMVCGPKKPVIPPEPNWVSFRDSWEVFGTGSVFEGKSGPQIHIHTSMGKRSKTLTGCVRKNAEVFITVEVFFMELKGINAKKVIDEKTGINMLKFL